MSAVLTVRDLTVVRDTTLALDRVSLTVAAGEVHGLVGPNGAGKTTLLQAVTGLLAPRSGEVEVFGERLVPGARLPATAAAVVDVPSFWPSMTGAEALRALGALDRSAASTTQTPDPLALLSRVGLAGAADRRVGEYSLGMRQRLGVAAALLRDPKLLVLDEPTGGLDPLGLETLREVVTELAANGCAVLLSSHDIPGVASLCSNVTVLRAGVAVFQGAVPEAREIRELREREPLVALFDSLVTGAVERPPAPEEATPHSAVVVAERPTFAGIRTVSRHELRRLVSQRPAHWLAAILALAPFAFAAVIHHQSALPVDTLFGRQLHDAGMAVPFVVLGFAASWLLPAIGGLAAGDAFSLEDLHGTWPLLLTRGRSRAEIFFGKIAAAFVTASIAVLLIAVGSVLAGLTSGGDQLVGTTGQSLSSGAAVGLALASWASVLPAVLAFAALGAALSVRTGRSWAGVGGPVLAGLVMLIVDQANGPALVRRVLLTPAMLSWHGFTQQPASAGAFVVSVLASIAWAAVAIAIGWRGFVAPGSSTRLADGPVLPAIGAVATAASLAVDLVVGGGAISSHRIGDALAASFNNRAELQQQVANLGGIAGGAPHARGATCARLSGSTSGAGSDWNCTLTWLTPDKVSQSARYELDVRTDGCYTASGPTSIVGGPTLTAGSGKNVTNPLGEFDGCIGLV